MRGKKRSSVLRIVKIYIFMISVIIRATLSAFLKNFFGKLLGKATVWVYTRYFYISKAIAIFQKELCHMVKSPSAILRDLFLSWDNIYSTSALLQYRFSSNLVFVKKQNFLNPTKLHLVRDPQVERNISTGHIFLPGAASVDGDKHSVFK